MSFPPVEFVLSPPAVVPSPVVVLVEFVVSPSLLSVGEMYLMSNCLVDVFLFSHWPVCTMWSV